MQGIFMPINTCQEQILSEDYRDFIVSQLQNDLFAEKFGTDLCTQETGAFYKTTVGIFSCLRNYSSSTNQIYELGFYNGFKFGVDPDDLYPETLEKLSNI